MRDNRKQDTYRGLLSPWERRVLKARNALPQHRYRVRRRLAKALDALPKELTDILFSPGFYSSNIRNLARWKNVQDALHHGFQHLLKPVEVNYPVIEVVNKDGKDHLYMSKVEKFQYAPGRVLAAELEESLAPTFWTEGLVIADRFDTEEVNRVVLELIHNPEELKLWLSLRHIKKKYSRNIVRKALNLGYRFPTGKENAVPLWKVKGWLDR